MAVKAAYKVRAYILFALAFVGLFCLGFYGFYCYQGASVFSSFYYTLQLLVLNGTPELNDNFVWQLKVASFGLPAYTIIAVLKVITKIVGVQWNIARVQLRPRKHVFLGAGRLSAGIIQSYKDHKSTKILAIDLSTEHEHAQWVKSCSNVLLIQHDINDSTILKKFALHKAKCIYCFTGNDERNITIARKVIQAISIAPAGRKINYPRIFINVESKSLLDIASREQDIRAYQEKGEVKWFSSNQESALALLRKHPPRLTPSSKVQAPLHIGLVGQNPCINELILTLIKQSPKLHAEELFITVFGESKQQHEQFMLDNPVLTEAGKHPEYGEHNEGGAIAHIEFVKVGAAGLTPGLAKQALAKQNSVPFAAFYILGCTDYTSLNAAFRVKQVLMALSSARPLPRLVIRLSGSQYSGYQEALAMTKDDSNKGVLDDAEWFHGVADILESDEAYPGETIDLMGQLIHAAYETLEELKFEAKDLNNFIDNLSDSPTSKLKRDTFHQELHNQIKILQNNVGSFKKSWKQLPEFNKTSSIQSGEHMFVKLRELGFQLVPKKANAAEHQPNESVALLNNLNAAIKDNFQRLNEMEYRRFVVERLLDGWLLPPSVANGAERSTTDTNHLKKLRLNATLNSYGELADEEKAKDRAINYVLSILVQEPFITARFELQKLP